MKILDYLGLTTLSEIIIGIRSATSSNASSIDSLGNDFSTFATTVNETFQEVDDSLGELDTKVNAVQDIKVSRW